MAELRIIFQCSIFNMVSSVKWFYPLNLACGVEAEDKTPNL